MTEPSLALDQESNRYPLSFIQEWFTASNADMPQAWTGCAVAPRNREGAVAFAPCERDDVANS
jgi:hypothetical protein